MKIGAVVGHFGQRVVDLIVQHHGIVAQVGQRDAAALAERHLPVAVVSAARIDAHGQRGERCESAPPRREKVADRTFHGRRVKPVVIDAQNLKAHVARRRHPDLLNGAHTVDIGQCERLARTDADAGRNLPPDAQIARAVCAGSFRRHAAPALFAGEILGRYRPRARVGQPRQIAQMHAEPVKTFHWQVLPVLSNRSRASGSRPADARIPGTLRAPIRLR